MDKTQYKRPESVLVVVYTQASTVLMMRRVFPADFWQSVTGSLEWDESPWDAACRELFEETGLSPRTLQDCEFSQVFEIYDIWRDRYPPGVRQNTEHVFRLQLAQEQPIQLDPGEHTECIWMPKNKAADLATSHTNRQAILEWVP